MSNVYVRAMTSDNRWASVDAMDLTDESFKLFVLKMLAESGIVSSIVDDNPVILRTNLTKAEADGETV